MALVHHTAGKMKVGQTPDLNNLAMAGFREWTRKWLLLNHRKKRQAGRMELVMTLGGSAGHGGEYHVSVDEGQPEDPLVGRRLVVGVERVDGDAEEAAEGPANQPGCRAEKP